MKFLSVLIPLVLLVAGLKGQTPAAKPPLGLLEVRRIYVGELTGGVQADALRELIISSLNGTGLFILTDNPERADAVLKGTGNDTTFTDTLDTNEGAGMHTTAGKGGSGSGSYRTGGFYGAATANDNEGHHIKDRKHEAYAAVRLCDRDGDVLWSTTQESLGAKFRSASADVAAKIARQLTLDVDRARRATEADH
ncbi:MAG: hypothetical protein JO108_29505 [Acidobacteriaceae bacterium]|nr:hypothetical protein [Acidobacteriaceae bacterium]